MIAFDLESRARAVLNFRKKNYDLFIVGGGINGAGAAREAALRGLKVGLSEKKDYASGTSSRSSKLIHGGIRYLENLEFGLVFEALSERAKLFEMAPHLSHPLRFLIPLFSGGRVGMFKMGLGMWLYDLLALLETPELHERLSARETMARQPELQHKNLLGSYVYSDGYMDDDRLVHETLRSAVENGADCASYAEVKKIKQRDDRLYEIEIYDHINQESFTVTAHHVLMTVGPWTDEMGSTTSSEWKKKLRPTKGVHLTFSKERFPLKQAVVMAAEDRIVFGIPRNDMVILGTTDTDYHLSPDAVATHAEDQSYLLGVANNYFPGMGLAEQDILGCYSGVRPLVIDGAATTGKVSREHSIWTESTGITFVAGGKYTTYRLISKQAIDACVKHLPWETKTRLQKAHSSAPLNPAATTDIFRSASNTVGQIQRQSRLSEKEAQSLFSRHGLDALEIIRSTSPELKYWQYEALLAIRCSQCFHLADFYLRRTPLSLGYHNHGLDFLPEIALTFQEELKWSPEKTQVECERLRQELARERHVV